MIDLTKNKLIYAEDAITSIFQEADRLEDNGAIPMGQGARAMAFVVDALPSAESKIIRCRDCKNYHKNECPMRHVEYILDGFDSSDEVIDDYATDDGFCYMGDRRENE